MLVKNKNTGLEVRADLSSRTGLRMAQFVFNDDDFEIIEISEEEKAILNPPEPEPESTIEDEILVDEDNTNDEEDEGELPAPQPSKKKVGKK